MRSRGFSLILGVLFILFSTNAYACLFPMIPSESMPMEASSSNMPSHEQPLLPCQAAPCDAMTSQKMTESNCVLSSPAFSLNTLQVVQPNSSVPPLAHAFRLPAAAPTPAVEIGLADDPPRPLSTVSLLLLHSTLRL